jgi:RNA polymerase sigma-70 factor (ECF subfamily)
MTIARTPFGEREAQLLARAQEGDRDAWNDLVERHLPEIQEVCFVALRHRETSEDAAQETFLKAQLALARFNAGSFGAWLTTIARNTCSDELRKQSRRERTVRLIGGAQEALALLDFVSRQAAIDRFREEEDEYGTQLLIELLYGIAPRERRVLQLVLLRDLPTREIAKRLGMSVKEVQAILHNTRRTLRRLGLDRPQMLSIVRAWRRERTYRDGRV